MVECESSLLILEIVVRQNHFWSRGPLQSDLTVFITVMQTWSVVMEMANLLSRDLSRELPSTQEDILKLQKKLVKGPPVHFLLNIWEGVFWMT